MKPLLKFTKEHIKSRDLITLSSFPEVQNLKKYRQEPRGSSNMKPDGIWFGIGDSWIDWLVYNMPQWAQPSILKVEVSFPKMFHIRKDSDLDVFSEKYTYKIEYPKYNMWQGDWKKLAEDYDGIIHWKYPSAGGGGIMSNNPRGIWYGWDVRSGCIWNPAAIKNLKIIGRYDEDKKEYVKL